MKAHESISLYTRLFTMLLVTAKASRLSVPKVLLPFFPGVEVPFTIEAGEGCYTWHAHHPEIISVKPIYENSTICSQKAILSSKSEQPKRVTTVVIAEEIVTGQILRCDVIVDVIVTMEIESRTRELYVDDAPVEFTVVGLDKEGNTFSSLAGINFQWTVMMDESLGILEPSTKVRILRYTETQYYIPEYITLMEKAGKQGEIVLVSGISTGASIVKVRIEGEFYKNIPAATICLLVLEKIFVTPCCEVLLLVHANVHFQVKRLVERKVTVLDPPIINYIVQLENQMVLPGGNPNLPVADFDETSLVLTGVQLGCANLIFAHKNIHMQDGSSLPNCTVCVVEPGYLGYSIHPGDLWILEVEELYEVNIQVYDKISSRGVYPSPNLQIGIRFPSEFFSLLFSSENGSYHIVRAIHIGTTTINASLIGVKSQDQPLWIFKNPIFQEQEVKIFLPIKLYPQRLTFPTCPREASYRYPVKVEGGSGNVSWLSTNKNIASVTTRGVVISTGQPGHCLIQANDIMNQLHSAETHILVLPVTSLELLPSSADTAVGRGIHIPLVVYGTYEGVSIPFINCSLLPLHISMDKDGVFSVEEEMCMFTPPSCTCLKILAQSPGNVVLTVSVITEDGKYHNNTIFSAYSPLKAVDPVHTSVLSLHSTKVMVFEGGPRPWLPEPSGFFIELLAQDWKSIQIHQIADSAKTKHKLHMYRVQCTKLGEQILTFQLGNKPGILNPRPSVEMVEVNLICALPARMSLHPVYTVPDGAQSCPIPKHNKQLVPLSMLRDTKLEMIIYDQHKRRFDNFSSLLIDWTSSNKTIADLSHNLGMQEISRSDATAQTWLHGQHLLEVKNIKGTVFITVTCAGYKPWVQVQDTSSFLITTTLELSLVDDVFILPNDITVFNHPEVVETLSLVEGSGYFLVNVSDSQIASTAYEETENTVKVMPLHTGTVTLEVLDLCILSANHATATIHISDIDALELNLVHKVEVGKSIDVLVKVWDLSHTPFLNKYFGIMKLSVQSSGPIVFLKKVPEKDKFSWSYLLRGIDIGQTTLIVTAYDKAGRRMTSAPHSVEVFGPFRLVPDKITIIPYNMIQITSEGGPQPQSAVHFYNSNNSVATINEVGQVTGLAVGTTKIRGTVQAINEDMGGSMVFSQDEIVVEVIHLKAIRIHVPVTRLITSTEMPVYVMGVSSTQTPFSFGNSKPPLQFYWSLNKRDVVTLESRMTESSVHLQPELNFAQLVRTWATGRVSIKVTVRSVIGDQFEGNATELKDQVQVVVLRGFALVFPKCTVQQILMAPNSYITVTTNKDGGASVTSNILQSFPNSSVIEDDGQVAPVSYLRIEVKPKLHTRSGHPLASFPVGITLELIVHFYSSSGEKFHAQKTQLCYAINRDDLLLIEPGIQNYTFLVTTVMQGETLLRIWDEAHPGMADFIPISVEDAILPNLKKPVAIGEVICFSTHLVNSNDEPGVWQTSATQFLQVDGVTGVAVARSKGITNVFYIITGMFTTYKQVTVESSELLIMRLASHGYLTNVPSTRQYNVHVSLSLTEPIIKGPCSNAQIEVAQVMLTSDNPLLCSVQFSNQSLLIPATKMFQITSQFNLETGQYNCKISIRPLTYIEIQTLSTAETMVELRASLLEHGGTGFLHVPLYPAFHVNQSELIFSSHELENYIRIYGISIVIGNLEITSSFPYFLFGKAIVSAEHTGLFLFPVSIVDFQSTQFSPVTQFINISCTVTGQDMALPVKILEGEKGKPGYLSTITNSIYLILFSVFCAVAISCGLFIVYNALIDHLQKTPIIYMSTLNGYSSVRSPRDITHHIVRRRSNFNGRLWSSRT
ncbi:nuclear pore membrane glycoprotein 210-like isoform X2 [Engystomops pustulosus]|uniref:nuclear pore membrane glycoprotein 210-like isoform X2 n=1 Tax=Engystomops pustulosus TaxID=76066 RepID=UPI003AFB4D2E